MTVHTAHQPSTDGTLAERRNDHSNRVLALQPDLFHYALQLTRKHCDAEDLVQDTMERALSKRHLFTPGTSLRAWLFTILRNRFLTQCRERRRWGDADDFDTAIATSSALASQEDSSHLGAVYRALRTLPKRDQRVIELAALRGLDYGDVARRLGVPSGTVRSRLCRARRRLGELTGGVAGLPA
jgi:RNA polymerase sigma-70 factor, ECF subfamily